MTTLPTPDLVEIGRHFAIPGQFSEARPYGNGHINDTYLSTYRTLTGEARYVHQRINHHVFKQPDRVMENILRVTAHIRHQVQAGNGNPARETLTLIPTAEGFYAYRDAEGYTWRTYHNIEGARTYDTAPNLRTVYEAAYAFGNFQKQLASLPGERLHETIPNFHHTRLRFEAFVRAIEADPVNRAAGVKRDIEFLLKREADASVVVDLLAQSRLPERVTHNDTKINNVLIDDQTGRGLCVIDLDTVMPGSTLYDFGDMVRAGASRGAEDEPDPARIGFDLSLFTQLARGYVHAARDFLTPAEFELLAFGGKLITYEQALRFLGDYVNGDVYYKIHRPNHNLDRARTQIKMIAEMEEQMGLMEAIIDRCKKEENHAANR